MHIGILGTGIVGQTLGARLAQLGHAVRLGTRYPARLDDAKGRGPHARTLRDWLAHAGSDARVGSFRDAAASGDLIVNALSGAASLEVLQEIGSATLHGKTLIDVANPIDASRGLPLTLFVKDTDSLGEILQRAFPDLRVVKALNAMPAALMVDPQLVGNGDHTVFLSGNDPEAKAQVTRLLSEFGWRDILDLGDISTARGTEMMLSIGHAVMRALSPARIAFKVVRQLHGVVEWTEGLRRFAAASRAARPLPDRGTMTLQQEWQCRIVGGSLMAWLQDHGPRFLQERAAKAELLGLDADPAIMFTSGMVGLVAAAEILGFDHEHVVFLLDEEFADAEARAADPCHTQHVHVWSRFLPRLEPDFAAQARAKHPIPASSSYWQHAEGTMWAPNAGRGGDHLWRWDGRQPELLEEAMSHWVA